ncbi:MAG: hypothetical protein AAFO04_29655 [Cyanobacteria bacterium J06592_8]
MALITIPDKIDRRVSFWLGCTGLLTIFTIAPNLDVRWKTLSSSVAIGCSILAYDCNHKNKPVAVLERARVDSELNIVSDYISAQEASQSEEIQYDLVTQIERLFKGSQTESQPQPEPQPSLTEVIEPKIIDPDTN